MGISAYEIIDPYFKKDGRNQEIQQVLIQLENLVILQ